MSSPSAFTHWRFVLLPIASSLPGIAGPSSSLSSISNRRAAQLSPLLAKASNVAFTGQAWGVGYQVYPAQNATTAAQNIAAWKAYDQNGPYFATTALGQMFRSQGSGPDPAWDAFRMRTLKWPVPG